ncbi:MAG TPA: hypothetical protein VKU00_02210 [Chthonomonadaceae bacterium]|nr:hypothetical protein [Chthonomonadaceae bacterium]
MNPHKRYGALMVLLIAAACLPGCDDPEDRTPELPKTPPPVISALDHPKFVEDFTVSGTNHAAGSDTTEVTLASNSTQRMPLTIRPERIQIINKKPRWFFRIENSSFSQWDGTIRIFLLSHGEIVDHEDVKPNKPMESSDVAPTGYGVTASMDSPFTPTALHGTVDQYGWAYDTKYTASQPASSPGTARTP